MGWREREGRKKKILHFSRDGEKFLWTVDPGGGRAGERLFRCIGHSQIGDYVLLSGFVFRDMLRITASDVFSEKCYLLSENGKKS